MTTLVPQTQQLDWDALGRRLSELTDATSAVAKLSPAEAAKVMDDRARELAQVPPTPLSAAEVLEVITFGLAGEQFGIETCYVRTVVRSSDITPVPGTPAFLVGVTNLRGEVLAVMALDKLLGIATQGPSQSPWVIVLGTQRAEFGIVADAVQEVISLRIEELLAPALSGAAARREYLRGVTPQALVVLDGAALLGDPRLHVDESE